MPRLMVPRKTKAAKVKEKRITQRDLLVREGYPPGTKVDVCYSISDWKTKEIKQVWVYGYRVFDPINIPVSGKAKTTKPIKCFDQLVRGCIGVVADSGGIVTAQQPRFIRKHDPSTSVSFQEAFSPSLSGKNL